MEDKLKTPKGKLVIQLFEGKRLVKEILTKNAVTTNGEALLLGCLAGYDYHVDQLKVYKSGGVLATSPLSVTSYTPGTPSLTFTATFDENSFNDTADELRLHTSSNGTIFSIVSGQSVTKSNAQRMIVTWTLEY